MAAWQGYSGGGPDGPMIPGSAREGEKAVWAWESDWIIISRNAPQEHKQKTHDCIGLLSNPRSHFRSFPGRTTPNCAFALLCRPRGKNSGRFGKRGLTATSARAQSPPARSPHRLPMHPDRSPETFAVIPAHQVVTVSSTIRPSKRWIVRSACRA